MNDQSLDSDKKLKKISDKSINNIRMNSYSRLKPEINKNKLKNIKKNMCVCHLERWCEECYGDFDLFD